MSNYSTHTKITFFATSLQIAQLKLSAISLFNQIGFMTLVSKILETKKLLLVLLLFVVFFCDKQSFVTQRVSSI